MVCSRGRVLGNGLGVLEEDARSVTVLKSKVEKKRYKGKRMSFKKSTKSRVYVEMSYDTKKKPTLLKINTF